MRTSDPIERRASELLEAAQRFRSAAQEPGCHVAAPGALGPLEETLQLLSAAWYQLAADAAPGIAYRRPREPAPAGSRSTTAGLPRELEVQLVGTLHDVAAGFARCARMCREGRSTVAPIMARATAPSDHRRDRPRARELDDQAGDLPAQAA
jgi:hypothetical protein